MITALAILSLVGSSALGDQPSAAMETRNLMDLVRAWSVAPLRADSTFHLAPEWVGTVKRVYLRGGEGVYREDKPDDVRFTHAWVRKAVNGWQLEIGRPNIAADGSFTFSELAVYRTHLPTANEISRIQSLDELRKVFGIQHQWSDGVGGEGWEDGMRWSEGWTWFTGEGVDRIRYLNVSGDLHKQGRAGHGATIDMLILREGIFRPADPNSAVEREKFKNGDELAAEEQAKRQVENEEYPLPLRSLVAARHAPDDSRLLAYAKALNEFRAKPSSELLRQLVAQLSNGNPEFPDMLSDLLGKKRDGLDLNPWQPEPRKAALRSSIEALSAAKSQEALQEALRPILAAFGGGRLVVKSPGSKETFDLTMKISANFEEWTDASSQFSENEIPGLVESTQRTLRARSIQSSGRR